MYGTAIQGLLDVAPAATLGFVAFCFLMFALGMSSPGEDREDESKA